ncbi:PfkB family carbohydrate kinase [Kiloniella majae]|uniref:PfkB family carbohydrate kinase n=1 Tax=Kiloniella majae TaxID=1938558 RepID=UPI000A277368|nr:PfkB family carbohydrate kinase [Kiloniella majae]
MNIHIIGGTYKEYCSWPEHKTLQGSAGRAALCLSQLTPKTTIKLHARIAANDQALLEETFAFTNNCELIVSNCKKTTKFDYFHPLSEPIVTPHITRGKLPTFDLSSDEFDSAIVFGMIETTPKVKCRVAVYDPQNTYNPILFSETGSTAETLIYVTNNNELSQFYINEKSSVDTIEIMANWLLKKEKASAIIVKCGQRGVFVHSKNENNWVPPYKTETIFPIGSGDSFVAAFTFYWLIKKLSLTDAARMSSIAAAYYVSHRIMNNEEGLNLFEKNLDPIKLNSKKKKVYLAGPFFTLPELWMINEAKHIIESFGVDVFSPYHEIGIGSAEEVVQKDIDAIKNCDVMYSLFNGTDPGTLFEIGYARSINKPVIILAENPKDEELKMYEGSGCKIFNDFASSIYHLAWLDT